MRIYRALVRLYPREFRAEFENDLVQAFSDLAGDRGAPAAWRRSLLDLTVTVPRYRLETIMSTHRSFVTIWVIAAALTLAAVAVLATDKGGPIAAVLLIVAATIAVAQRSSLSRSLRPASAGARRRLWHQTVTATSLAVAVLAIALADLNDEEHWPAGRLIAYNLAFLAAALTAVISFALALRRPRST